MRGTSRVLSSLAFLILLSHFIDGEDYKVSITNVNVWVRVTDHSGKPVQHMKKEEFEIFEDGKKVSSQCFEEVQFLFSDDMPQTVVNSKSSEKNIGKRFVLFLDLHNTTHIEFERIRPKLDEFLNQLAAGNWEVMLVAYLASGKLGIVSPFTRDFVRMRALLDQAKGNAQRDQKIARNENELLDILSVLKVSRDAADVLDTQQEDGDFMQEAEGGQGGNRGGAGPTIEEQFFKLAVGNAYRQAQYFAKQERNDGEHSFAAVESFGEYYGDRLSEGEHTIILFLSGGINSDPGRRYYDLINGFVTKQAANVNSAEFSTTFSDSTREVNFDLEKQIRHSVGKLNRYNLTLYAINTRGLVGSGPDVARMESSVAAFDVNLARDYQDSLSQIAQETGGLSFQNSQNFRVGFDNILADLSHQYLLCYTPPEHKEDGEYHSIKVVSKRAGVNLRHRLGYVD
jgi:VWFA-related protein